MNKSIEQLSLEFNTMEKTTVVKFEQEISHWNNKQMATLCASFFAILLSAFVFFNYDFSGKLNYLFISTSCIFGLVAYSGIAWRRSETRYKKIASQATKELEEFYTETNLTTIFAGLHSHKEIYGEEYIAKKVSHAYDILTSASEGYAQKHKELTHLFYLINNKEKCAQQQALERAEPERKNKIMLAAQALSTTASIPPQYLYTK